MSSLEQEELVFRALADRTRRQILDHIRDEPLTTGALCTMLEPLDRCTVMMHLKVLEGASLVVAVRRGRHRLNVLNVGPLLDIQARWLGRFTGSAVELLGRLREFDQTESPVPTTPQ